MSAARLLNQLTKVRSNGKGKWLACCPAHEDRSPSLSIRELDDGRILLHCFGGCDVRTVLAAVGLTFSDLYPDNLIPGAKRERMPFSYADALRCIAFEATLVAVAAGNLAQGVELSDVDRARLMLAAHRVNRALEVCQ